MWRRRTLVMAATFTRVERFRVDMNRVDLTRVDFTRVNYTASAREGHEIPAGARPSCSFRSPEAVV